MRFTLVCCGGANEDPPPPAKRRKPNDPSGSKAQVKRHKQGHVQSTGKAASGRQLRSHSREGSDHQEGVAQPQSPGSWPSGLKNTPACSEKSSRRAKRQRGGPAAQAQPTPSHVGVGLSEGAGPTLVMPPALESSHSPSPPPAVSASTLLNLPQELLQHIANHLPFTSFLALTHTCRGAHQLLWQLREQVCACQWDHAFFSGLPLLRSNANSSDDECHHAP